MQNGRPNLRVDVAIDKDTGRTLAVYFQIRNGKAAEVREIEDGVAYANYNRKGELLGVEILAPAASPSLIASRDKSRRKSSASSKTTSRARWWQQVRSRCVRLVSAAKGKADALHQLVRRPRRVKHLRRALGADHRQRLRVEKSELHEHGGLIPVDVLV